MPANPASKVFSNKLSLVNPITRERFGDPVTIVCEITKVPKVKQEEPQPILKKNGSDTKSKILGDIQNDAGLAINYIDDLLHDIESEEVSDVDRISGDELDNSEFEVIDQMQFHQ